ncbi:MAG: hypothetical protein FWD35_05520, partial [Oscillospiraceae bacterium]|nr:hypothetical protein [Oscillospiraceae bacterium]
NYIPLISVSALLTAGVVALVIWLTTPVLIEDDVTVSIIMGEDLPEPAKWFTRRGGSAAFAEESAKLDTMKPGEHEVALVIGNRRFEATLLIVDNIDPVATPVDVISPTGKELTPSDFYTDLFDHSSTTSAFIDAPNINTPGIYNVTVRISDAFNNNTTINAVCEIFALNSPIYVEAGEKTPRSAFTLEGFAAFTDLTRITDTPELDLLELPEDFYATTGEYPVHIIIDGVPFPAAIVVRDTTPPVISGTRDLTALVGTTLSYRAGVTVTDNYDTNPRLSIDSNLVDLRQIGTYTAIYTATDASGNSASVSVTVTVVDIESHELYAAAHERLTELGVFNTDDPAEKTRLIHRYVIRNLEYHDNNPFDSSDETQFAYNVLRNMRGNCLAAQRVSEVLLTMAGIENRRIRNTGAPILNHVWNLVHINGEWYHFDSTDFKDSKYPDTHMFTVATSRTLSGQRRNVYTYETAGLPPIRES